MVVINFNFNLFFRYLFEQYGSASIIKICITRSISVSKKVILLDICSLISLSIYLISHLFICLCIYLVNTYFFQSVFNYLFIYLFIHLFDYSFSYSVIHSFIYLFTYLFIYLFIDLFEYLLMTFFAASRNK